MRSKETLKQEITEELLKKDVFTASCIRASLERNNYKTIFGVEFSDLEKRDFIETCNHIEITEA